MCVLYIRNPCTMKLLHPWQDFPLQTIVNISAGISRRLMDVTVLYKLQGVCVCSSFCSSTFIYLLTTCGILTSTCVTDRHLGPNSHNVTSARYKPIRTQHEMMQNTLADEADVPICLQDCIQCLGHTTCLTKWLHCSHYTTFCLAIAHLRVVVCTRHKWSATGSHVTKPFFHQ